MAQPTAESPLWLALFRRGARDATLDRALRAEDLQALWAEAPAATLVDVARLAGMPVPRLLRTLAGVLSDVADPAAGGALRWASAGAQMTVDAKAARAAVELPDDERHVDVCESAALYAVHRVVDTLEVLASDELDEAVRQALPFGEVAEGLAPPGPGEGSSEGEAAA